ncbi:hypothetical protein TYRP_022424 [Tyrophagus putrescentiae]|nr:hypothetical protein TYRP_022424 [Tyrophagus putrescentiae]
MDTLYSIGVQGMPPIDRRSLISSSEAPSLTKRSVAFCVYPKRLFLTISAIDESVAVPEDRQRGILLANLLLRNKLN